MKKNRMMRLASMLLVAVLVTTSTISGTFAKYVTSNSATDVARVAKFGVEVKSSGYLFDKMYKDSKVTDVALSTVFSSTSEKVVAPGTNNADDPLTFMVTGTPEVDVNVKVEVSGGNEIFLKKGEHPNMTTGVVGDKMNMTALLDDYYPVVFTLKQTNELGTKVTTGKLSDIMTELNNLDQDYTAGANLADKVGGLELTWAWKFQETTGGPDAYDIYDQCDTLLGDLAAGTAEAVDNVNAADYNLETDLAITITVTQLD